MRSPSALVVYALAVGLLAHVPARAGDESRRIRAIDPASAEALARGLRDSASFRALAATLNTSTAIVHIVTLRELPLGLGLVGDLDARLLAPEQVRHQHHVALLGPAVAAGGRDSIGGPFGHTGGFL